MTTWERPAAAAAAAREGKNQGRRKTPSFSSSLLDAIYHSIDVSEGKENEKREGTENNNGSGLHGRRNHALKVEEEIANLRRAIMVEKWMENYPSAPASRASSRRLNSDSSSSTDSSFFSSSETEYASKSSSSTGPNTNPKHEGRFIMRTKSRALKIYGDLKKVKQPISPGGKIANFLNSIFNSRNVKKHHHHHHHQGVVVVEDWRSAVRKSRSVNDSTPHRPPPPQPPCSRTKSNKRSVRFCPVGVIVDEYSQPCGHMSIYDDANDKDPSLTPIPSISSHYIKKNIDSFRNYEEKNPKKKHKYRGFYNDDDDDSYDNDDGNSCTSSDLFELENIGLVGIGGGNREELPVYGTTNLKMNQAIAKGLLFV